MVIASCCANARIHAERVNLDSYEEFDLIDYSYQYLSVLPEFVIKNAAVVKHLILDGNQFDEHVFDEADVRFPELETLSFNCNQVTNIGVFIQYLSHKCPNLRFLSLINNPGWPHPLRNDSPELYHKYITSVLKFLPKLCFLDSVNVEARRKTSTTN